MANALDNQWKEIGVLWSIKGYHYEKSRNINFAQDNVKAENVTREREERPLIIVAGDSIVKGLKGWLMPRRANVKVFSFSGSTITSMVVYLLTA